MYGSKVSVVTVCYNSVRVIERTIKSVISLDYPNIEYLIIDGKSTDGTVDIIKKYNNNISMWISEPDKGVYDAMNKGVKMATGDWIIFLNAGDFFHSSNVFSDFISAIKDDTIVAYGLIHYFTHNVERDMQYIPIEKMLYLDPIPHPATMIRLSYHKEHYFDTSFKSSGDYDFFYRAYFDDQVIFQFIPVVMTDYDNSGGLSKDNFYLVWQENRRIWTRRASIWLKIKMYSEWVLSNVKRTIRRVIKQRY